MLECTPSSTLLTIACIELGLPARHFCKTGSWNPSQFDENGNLRIVPQATPPPTQPESDGKLVTADLATVCMGSHPRFGRELQMSRPGDRSRALHCTLSTTRQSFRARIITPLLEKDDSNGDKQSANSRPAGRNVRNCACAEGTDQPCR